MKWFDITTTAVCLCFLFGASPIALAQDTTTATREDLNLDVNIGGVFVADDKDEIKIEPKAYTGELIITRIVPEGATVKTGDVLIEFDSAELDEAIEEARNEVTDAAVELKKVNAEYQSAVIDKGSQETQLQAELDVLKREVEAAKAQQVLDIEEKKRELVQSRERLEQLKNDMKMLQNIYNERNLQTSTSGDILLERQRISIENAEKGIQFEVRRLEYFEKFDQNKEQLEKELDIEKKQAELEKQTILLAAEVREKESLVTKAQRKLDDANEKIGKLQHDRDQLQVVSPRDGVVFYGETGNELPAGIIIGGTMRDVRDELHIGGRIRIHEILMTIATMTHLSIKMDVPEEDIQHLENGLPITVYPDAFPKDSFAGKLTTVEQTPASTSFYVNAEKRFKVMGKCTELAPLLRSGMNCRVTIHTEVVKDAVLIPVVAVVESDGDYYCYVSKGGEPERRKVTIGFANTEKVQVTDGLNEGEIVYLGVPGKGANQ